MGKGVERPAHGHGPEPDAAIFRGGGDPAAIGRVRTLGRHFSTTSRQKMNLEPLDRFRLFCRRKPGRYDALDPEGSKRVEKSPRGEDGHDLVAQEVHRDSHCVEVHVLGGSGAFEEETQIAATLQRERGKRNRTNQLPKERKVKDLSKPQRIRDHGYVL